MNNSLKHSLRVIVFAKAPLPGFAKTRLVPALGEEGAAALAEKMLRYTLCQCVEAEVGSIELCVAPGVEHSYWQSFSLPQAVRMSSQGEGDLGQRLRRAAMRANNAGDPVLLVGTDCPQLTAGRLRAAASALKNSDAAIYPARDGGYVLLGLNRAEPVLFEHIRWSTGMVARQTRERLDQCNMRCAWLETLVDIDEPRDLEALPESWL